MTLCCYLSTCKVMSPYAGRMEHAMVCDPTSQPNITTSLQLQCEASTVV